MDSAPEVETLSRSPSADDAAAEPNFPQTDAGAQAVASAPAPLSGNETEEDADKPGSPPPTPSNQADGADPRKQSSPLTPVKLEGQQTGVAARLKQNFAMWYEVE